LLLLPFQQQQQQQQRQMKIVGLTGGISCGKSLCSQHLVQQGVPVIDADLIARQIVQPGKPAWKLIRKHFGDDVLLPDGNLNRPKLGGIIFSDLEYYYYYYYY
jgi:dephospho-CoA kinase